MYPCGLCCGSRTSEGGRAPWSRPPSHDLRQSQCICRTAWSARPTLASTAATQRAAKYALATAAVITSTPVAGVAEAGAVRNPLQFRPGSGSDASIDGEAIASLKFEDRSFGQRAERAVNGEVVIVQGVVQVALQLLD